MEKTYYPALDETVYRHTLTNGLPMAVIHRPGFTKKLMYFVTDYGSIHTSYAINGKAAQAPDGVAHFLEHKLFDMPGRDITAEFAALGASPNAFTGYDMTAYYVSCTENFPECLKLLLEFVSQPHFTAESVEKEQGIIGQEIAMNADNPDTRIFENLMTAMYRSHPVSHPILGTEDSISQITPAILYECHRAFYAPHNMYLCIMGDVDPVQAAAIAEATLPKGPFPQATPCRQWQEDMTCVQPSVTDTMEVAMPMFQLGFKCEPLGKGLAAVRQEYIGDLAAELLFGESSQLYLKLYEEGRIDSSFGGGLETIEGMCMLSASGDSDDPEGVKDAILDYAARVLETGISPEALLRMKRSAMGRRLLALDSFDSTCFRSCAYHFSDFDYFTFPQVYEAITEQDLLDFIMRTVTPSRCCLSVILPN